MKENEAISKIEIPLKTDIIINSGHSYSRIRSFIRRSFAQIFGYGILNTIIIFNKNSDEQRKFLIIEAIKGALYNIELLDADFIEDLVKYHAFRYASEIKSVDKNITFLLRKDYEGTQYRDCINKLMDFNYSEEVVLNPPPEKRPLLEEIILPIVIEWEKALDDSDSSHAERERFKSLFMNFLKGLCDKTWGILFIGAYNIGIYLDLFDYNINKYDNGILLAARGGYIAKLNELWYEIDNKLLQKRNIKFNPSDVFYQKTIRKGFTTNCFRKFLLRE